MDQKELIIFNTVKRYFRVNPNIVDIGGFKGDWTGEVLKRLSSYTVHIFEPNKDNFEFISNRFLGNDNIFMYQLGVGDSCSTKKYYDLKSDEIVRQMSGFVKRDIYNSYDFDELEMDIVNLDSLELSNDLIDFIKIDVEGYEYNVFVGMKNMLLRSNIRFIQFEYGGTYVDANYSLNDIILFLSQFGYHVYDITENGDFIRLKDYDDDFQYNNFIATKFVV